MIPGPGGVLPALTIAGATRTSAEGRVASTYVVGRITSDRAYPTMGIAPGVNYVWRDTAGAVPSPYRLFIVPQDVAYPIFFLRKDTAYPRYAAGPAPQVVKSSAGVGACVEGCGMGHCPLRDTLRVYLQSDSTSVRVLL